MLDPKTEFTIRLDESGGAAQWTPSPDLDYFKGHFPNNPILPGVAIIDVSIEILRRALSVEKLYVKKIKSCKFMEPVLPGALIDIAFHEGPPNEWSFEWKSYAKLTFIL